MQKQEVPILSCKDHNHRAWNERFCAHPAGVGQGQCSLHGVHQHLAAKPVVLDVLEEHLGSVRGAQLHIAGRFLPSEGNARPYTA